MSLSRIRRDIVFHTLLTSSVALISLGVLVYHIYRDTLIEKEVEILGIENLQSATRLRETLLALRGHASYLVGTPPIQGLINARLNQGFDPSDKSTEDQWRKRLATLFTQKIKTYPEIFQTRLILADGQEYLNIKHRDDGSIYVVPDSELQNKSDTEYFRQTSRLKFGEVFLSDFNLNKEFGKIEVPYQPVVRAATPAFDSKGNFFGVIVVNVRARDVLELFRVESGVREALLVDQEGEYLLHPDSAKSFQFEFGQAVSLDKDDPELFRKIKENSLGESKNQLVSYVKEDEGVNFSLVFLGPERFVALINKSSIAPIVERLRYLQRDIALVALFVIIFSTLLTLHYSKTITAPLLKLSRVVGEFSGEGKVEDLPLKAKGEVGELAREIEKMSERIVTEKRNKDEALKKLAESNAELESSNRDLESFAYSASHDLRAPLQGIQKLVWMLEEDPDTIFSEDGKRKLEMLSGRAARLKGLLEGLLEYSRVGRHELQKEVVDTNLLVAETIGLIQAPEGFKVSIEGELPEVYCYKNPLEKVFLNLINNAIKHHDKKNGLVHVFGTVRDTFVEFAVADDGPGIEEKYREQIFDLLRTLKPRDQVEASGIGLAIVKKTIEDMGGEVFIESNPEGRGSVFKFTIPI